MGVLKGSLRRKCIFDGLLESESSFDSDESTVMNQSVDGWLQVIKDGNVMIGRNSNHKRAAIGR